MDTRQAQQEKIVSILTKALANLTYLASEEQRVTHDQFISDHFRVALDSINTRLKFEKVNLLKIRTIGRSNEK